MRVWESVPAAAPTRPSGPDEREFFIDNRLVRIHFIIVMIRWTGLAPWEFESPFPGSLTSTCLVVLKRSMIPRQSDTTVIYESILLLVNLGKLREREMRFVQCSLVFTKGWGGGGHVVNCR